MSITSESAGHPPGASRAERAAVARELSATDVDLRDPAAATAVLDLVVVVHDLLSRP